ncbi:MAG: hypothetical protein NTV95_04295 [Candidatus Saccharibacteria bacterium]|nr:hypothetical protein [Candidatus Saccharibacteria bacterium]
MTRISEDSISKLQAILKKHHKLDYDNEKAQAAGRAILRLVGLKLQKQLTKEYEHES